MRWRFGACSEQLDATQKNLLEESIDVDIAAIELQLKQLRPAAAAKYAPRHTQLMTKVRRDITLPAIASELIIIRVAILNGAPIASTKHTRPSPSSVDGYKLPHGKHTRRRRDLFGAAYSSWRTPHGQ